MKEELDFYQIDLPKQVQVQAQAQSSQSLTVIFVQSPYGGYNLANNATKMTRRSNGSCGIRADKDLILPGMTYEWTIRLDSIIASNWIAVGVADENASNYTSMIGISSANQSFPGNNNANVSGDWMTGDLIHVLMKNTSITITNKRTTRAHTLEVPLNKVLYPFFDIQVRGLSISFVDFKSY